MADAMIGFGKGLTGTPADYTGIVAAQNRQKQADDIRERARQDKEAEDTRKALDLSNATILPYQKDEFYRKFDAMAKGLAKARQEHDYNAEGKIKFDFDQYRRQLGQEFSDYHKVKDAAQNGHVLIEGMDELGKANNQQEADAVAKKYPGYFSPQTNFGVMGFNPHHNVDLVKKYQEIARGQTPVLNEKEKIVVRDSAGNAIPGYQEYYDEPQFEASVTAALDSDPDYAHKTLYNYRRRADTTGMTPQQIEAGAKQMAVDDAKTFMKNNGYKFFKGGKGMNITLNTGDQNNPMTTPQGDYDVNIAFTKGEQATPVRVYEMAATGNDPVQLPNTGDMFVQDGNEQVTDVGNSPATYNGAAASYVVKDNFKIPNPKNATAEEKKLFDSLSIPTQRYILSHSDTEIKKGSMVHPEILEYLKKKGLVDVSIVKFGEVNGGPHDKTPVYRSAGLLDQNRVYKSNAKDRPALEELFKRQKEMQSELKQGLSSGVKAPIEKAHATPNKKVNVTTFFPK